jgi:branched-subunit amino acid aminotransferase/4-amino-4-deoxychorismate lyase
MDVGARVLDWQAGALVARDDCDATPAVLQVADSFLVSDGSALAVGLHRTRFADSAREQGFGDALELAGFWDAALASIPGSGVWFPRLELVRMRDADHLRFRLRPAPELRETVVLSTAAADPRRTPTIKGPDLEQLSALRQRAQRSGAGEAVILDRGRVSDGATSALLWWRGDTLLAPPLSFPRVDSVGARAVRGIAAALRTPVDEEAATPDDLAGCVIWAVNALHGIREVTGWIDGPAVARDPRRLAAWRERLAALSRPL